MKNLLKIIFGRNLTIGRGNTEISESREVSTTSIREIATMVTLLHGYIAGDSGIKKALLLEGLFASVEGSFRGLLCQIGSLMLAQERNLSSIKKTLEKGSLLHDLRRHALPRAIFIIHVCLN